MLRTLKDHQKERTADIFFEIPDERKQRLSVKLRNSHFNYVQVKNQKFAHQLSFKQVTIWYFTHWGKTNRTTLCSMTNSNTGKNTQ